MPKAAPRPCSRPGCGRLIPFDGACPVHPARDNSFSDSRRGSRQSRGYGTEWDRVRAVAIDRDMGLCQPCLKVGRTTRFAAVDHIVCKALAERLGWSRERMDDLSNLQCICRPCHDVKTAADRDEVEAVRVGGVGMFRRLITGPTL